ncbi:hypothetical protein HK102_002327 [Quaeritorhiza haematococci]|nr:hypothetical protein HK102_002327 [Quaeritorhiza haematococci]
MAVEGDEIEQHGAEYATDIPPNTPHAPEASCQTHSVHVPIYEEATDSKQPQRSASIHESGNIDEVEDVFDKQSQKVHRVEGWISRLETRLRLRPPTIEPFPSLERPLLAPVTTVLVGYMDRVPSAWRGLVKIFFTVVWIVVASIFVKYNNYSANTSLGTPAYIDCTTQLWAWKADLCGPDGLYCQPFTNKSFVVRCPSNCHLTFNQNRRFLGSTPQGMLQPWIVGNETYRAESWICPTAIHAGVVSAAWGGCAVIDVVGESSSFPSTTAHGLTSLFFDSWFPKSYRVRPIDSTFCTDNSWAVLPAEIIFAGLFAFVRPSRGAWVFALVSAGFWHVVLVGIPVHDDAWISASWGHYLVTLAYTYVVYSWFLRKTLPLPKRFPIDLFVFVVLPFYFALHFEFITAPLSNFGLTSRAFRNPTTLIVFVIGVPTVIIICCFQLYLLRRHGLLGKYLLGYGSLLAAFFILPLLFKLNIHLHHYMIGFLLLPLARLQTRPALIMQGFLLGLLVQGLARWGPDSPFVTAFQNLAGDDAGTPRPIMNVNVTDLAQNGTLSWSVPDSLDVGIDLNNNFTYSLMLNDVEVYRGSATRFAVPRIKADPDPTRPYYARIALVVSGTALDYSDPITVRRNGTVVYANGTIVGP